MSLALELMAVLCLYISTSNSNQLNSSTRQVSMHRALSSIASIQRIRTTASAPVHSSHKITNEKTPHLTSRTNLHTLTTSKFVTINESFAKTVTSTITENTSKPTESTNSQLKMIGQLANTRSTPLVKSATSVEKEPLTQTLVAAESTLMQTMSIMTTTPPSKATPPLPVERGATQRFFYRGRRGGNSPPGPSFSPPVIGRGYHRAWSINAKT